MHVSILFLVVTVTAVAASLDSDWDGKHHHHGHNHGHHHDHHYKPKHKGGDLKCWTRKEGEKTVSWQDCNPSHHSSNSNKGHKSKSHYKGTYYQKPRSTRRPKLVAVMKDKGHLDKWENSGKKTFDHWSGWGKYNTPIRHDKHHKGKHHHNHNNGYTWHYPEYNGHHKGWTHHTEHIDFSKLP